MENTSKRLQLNSTDLRKTGRGLLVTLIGAALTYVGSIYLQIDYTASISGTEVNLTPIAVAVIGAALELGRRWLTDYSARG